MYSFDKTHNLNIFIKYIIDSIVSFLIAGIIGVGHLAASTFRFFPRNVSFFIYK